MPALARARSRPEEATELSTLTIECHVVAEAGTPLPIRCSRFVGHDSCAFLGFSIGKILFLFLDRCKWVLLTCGFAWQTAASDR